MTPKTLQVQGVMAVIVVKNLMYGGAEDKIFNCFPSHSEQGLIDMADLFLIPIIRGIGKIQDSGCQAGVCRQNAREFLETDILITADLNEADQKMGQAWQAFKRFYACEKILKTFIHILPPNIQKAS
jgi:hypothetical protein